MKFLLAALALGVPATAIAVPAHAAVAPDRKADATALAELLLPREQILGLLDVMFHSGLDAELAKNAQVRAAFERNPGIRDAIWTAVRPEMIAILDTAMIGMREELRDLFLREFSDQELSETLAFFASPTGRKLYGHALQSAAEDTTDATEATPEMVDDLMSKMTPEDMKLLNAFGRSAGGRKLGLIADEMGRISERWGKLIIAQYGDRLETMIRDAVDKYLAEHGKARP